jgi:hypothetical protein
MSKYYKYKCIKYKTKYERLKILIEGGSGEQKGTPKSEKVWLVLGGGDLTKTTERWDNYIDGEYKSADIFVRWEAVDANIKVHEDHQIFRGDVKFDFNDFKDLDTLKDNYYDYITFDTYTNYWAKWSKAHLAILCKKLKKRGIFYIPYKLNDHSRRGVKSISQEYYDEMDKYHDMCKGIKYWMGTDFGLSVSKQFSTADEVKQFNDHMKGYTIKLMSWNIKMFFDLFGKVTTGPLPHSTPGIPTMEKKYYIIKKIKDSPTDEEIDIYKTEYETCRDKFDIIKLKDLYTNIDPKLF